MLYGDWGLGIGDWGLGFRNSDIHLLRSYSFASNRLASSMVVTTIEGWGSLSSPTMMPSGCDGYGAADCRF